MKINTIKNTLLLLTAAVPMLLAGQAPLRAQADREFETDPVILSRIDRWQDLKFGFMMHWGIYSQWGVVESWSICSEPWIVRDQLGENGPMKGCPGADYYEYKKAYQALNRTFNPQNFNPGEWARVAKRAGMKYVVFTTKHHDGFCMFDSKYTSYTSMGPECPAKKDFTRGVVDAFRGEGFWTGLYFSKPDWHNDNYWAHEWATPDRNVNYSIADHPDRWRYFCDFTYNQIRELTQNYGKVDILWLDGGWVRPAWSVNDETLPWLGLSGQVQDINMPLIAQMARESNPQMLIVDRSVGGRYENYRTPEKQVPDTPLPYPWETCMTMGDSWSYVPDDNYKSTKTLIHMLVDVVAKGGNLLLNVGPDADGNLPREAVQRMEEIGRWLTKYGYAIYGTRPLAPYREGNVRYTQSKDGQRHYAITLIDEPPYATVKKIYSAGPKTKAEKLAEKQEREAQRLAEKQAKAERKRAAKMARKARKQEEQRLKAEKEAHVEAARLAEEPAPKAEPVQAEAPQREEPVASEYTPQVETPAVEEPAVGAPVGQEVVEPAANTTAKVVPTQKKGTKATVRKKRGKARGAVARKKATAKKGTAKKRRHSAKRRRRAAAPKTVTQTNA